MSNLPIEQILQDLGKGRPLTGVQCQQLIDHHLQQQQNGKATLDSLHERETVQRSVERQANFFLNHYPSFAAFCHDRLGLYQQIADHLWNFWLPLAQRLKEQRDHHQCPWIQGIVGLQGTGKTTLTQILTWILHKWEYRCLCLSLDDLYLPYSDRLRLQQAHPFLIWRGPPGTHDVGLGGAILTELRAQTKQTGIWVPRFDKSRHEGAGDRAAPEWIRYPVDIVLFEGWFVGMVPLVTEQTHPSSLTASPLAEYCNQQLHHYVPLWKHLDNLLILYLPESYFSKVWRKEAEQKLNAQTRSAMAEAEVDRFVDYFWDALPPALFLDHLTEVTYPTQVIELRPDRSPPMFPGFP